MCRLYRWLYAVVPITFLRAWLIRGHLGVCPHCCLRLADTELLESRLPLPRWTTAVPDLWPAIAAAMARARMEAVAGQSRPPRILSWRWATVPVMVAMLVLPLWRMLHRDPASAVVEKTAAKRTAPFTLLSASIDGKPATPYVVQEPGSDLVIVWLEKN